MKDGKVRLFVFIDALGWTLTEHWNFGGGFLPVRCPVRTQFGYSAGAVPTILSGRPPAEHGQFSFFFYQPATSPFRLFRLLPARLLPAALFDRHRVRHWLSKLIKKYYGYTGYFELYAVPWERLPLLDYSEKRDLFVPGGLAPIKNLADCWAGRNACISNWRCSSDDNFAEMTARLKTGQLQYGFLYCGSLDGFLHRHIAEPDAVEAELKRYEAKVAALLETARQHYRTVEFAVISDHGMTPLAGTVDGNAALARLPLRWGKEYVSFLDATMARFWFPDPAARPAIRETMAALGHGRWLSAEEQQTFGIAFPDRKYGEEIYLLEPGWQFAPSDMGRAALPGMHGYEPEHAGSTACFLSNYVPAKRPEWIGDFFHLMTED
ncbi:alkaline phosphatase family protein [Victivallis sp. Marseille-Q1083]|uniref:alkaline phosphatase family protein n=1 Tax=Victivallis sp. Marseille-Q1083 TaxID=2717288 RepID=UPI00158AFCB4|nr:alkaline phosphatase family protein [Victivallis sp. Marseille-Q1083]